MMALLLFLCRTSQTKPGPNMALAVAIKVSLRDSGEEKESLIRDLRVEDICGGLGDRVEKNWWLAQAMLAWLKREAAWGCRAWVTMRSFVVEKKKGESE